MIFSDYCYCLCPSSWRLQAGCAADGWKRGGNCANISMSGLQRSLPVFSRADRPKGSPPEHMIIFINRTVMCHLIKKKTLSFIHPCLLSDKLTDRQRPSNFQFPCLAGFHLQTSTSFLLFCSICPQSLVFTP